jgi:hypothetical protein
MATNYRHSGVVPAAGALLVPGVGLLVALLSGSIYSLAIVSIPFVYLNIALTAIFGLAVGATIGAVGRQCNVRNTPFMIGVTLAVTAAGYYTAWAVDFLMRVRPADENGIWIAWNPEVLGRYVEFFYEQGGWTFGGHVINDLQLGLVWLLEAAIIFGIAVYVVLEFVGNRTFCEACNRWSRHKPEAARFAPGSDDVIRVLVDLGDLSKLIALGPDSEDDDHFWRLETYLCPSCDEHCCVTVQAGEVKATANGHQTKLKKLVDRLMIDKRQLDRLAPAPELEASPENI